eukprot:TRINITY_DN1890_c0_g2_i1.p1 TRINITY_DN1890_c0_g2~~TRINITY_DN1890_c0_g2_i1.p1  ORF type:complete len:460 (+),score=97.62 TRINITY_DN1890_c0_g2_i1:147-1526(+)
MAGETPAEPTIPEGNGEQSARSEEECEQMQRLFSLLRDAKLKVKSSKKKGFKASELVKWLTKEHGSTEGEALEIGNDLQKAYLIFRLSSRTSATVPPSAACGSKFAFHNDSSRYQFYDVDTVGVMNLKNYCSVTHLTPNELSRKLQNQMNVIKDRFMDSSGQSVDYEAIVQSNEFVEFVVTTLSLQELNIGDLTPTERKSFFINTYNALVIHGNIMIGAPRNAFQRSTFYSKVSYNIGGLTYALSDIEHGVLRGNRKPPGPFSGKRFGKNDPRLKYICELDHRIHFALNCGAKSCPPINVFVPDTIDEDLDLAAEAFCEQEVQVKPMKKQVVMSSLMYWYAKDFGSNKSEICSTIARYVDAEKRDAMTMMTKGKFTLKYARYDWGTNSKKLNDAAKTDSETNEDFVAIPLYQLHATRLSLLDREGAADCIDACQLDTPPLSPSSDPKKKNKKKNGRVTE